MRQKVAKYLRREAAKEMGQSGVAERELVTGRTTAVNNPQSVRAMYLALTGAYKNMRSSSTTKQQFVVQSTNITSGVFNG